MVEGGDLAEAELAYQRALTALHEARAAVSDASAARRRFVFDRIRLSPELAAARSAELDAAHDALAAKADALREQASVLRERLRRLTDDRADEPDDVPDDEPDAGFRQPPFTAGP